MPDFYHTYCASCARPFSFETSRVCPSCQHKISADLVRLRETLAEEISRKNYVGIVTEAVQFVRNDKVEEAALIVHALQESGYTHDEDFRKIGMLLHESHKDALALVCCERALVINPQDSWNHHCVALCYTQIGMLDKALKAAQEAIRLRPSEGSHYRTLAHVYDRLGQHTHSAKAVLQEIALTNQYDKIFDHLIEETVDLTQLESYSQDVLKTHPQATAVYLAMGNLYLGKSNFQRAEEHFKQAIGAQPNDSHLLNKLAEVYQKQNKLDAAVEQYKKILAFDEHNIETLRNLGKLFKDKSKWAEALAYFERILKINFKDSNAAYETKEMYRKLGNPQKAIEVMKDYQKADVSYFNWAMHHIFEILYYDLKDDKQLCELVESTYPNKVNESFVYDYYGYSLMNLGRLDQAVKSFERFQELEPKNARVMRELGRVFCDLQRYQDAIDVLKKSFAIESKNSYGFYYLALAYHKLNRNDLARKTLEEGKQYDPNYKWFDDLLSEIDPNYSTTQTQETATSSQTTSAVLGEPVLAGMPNFLRDLTQLAKEKKLEDIYGRQVELREMIEVLCRRSKANPLIVGQPGVGKTVLVNGLAHLLARREVPEIIREYRLLELEVFAVVAGTRYVGTLEQKFMQLAQFCRSNKVIIFIDELHTLMGAGSYSSHETGGLDEMFKPLLTQPDFKLIGATTDEEYQKNIAKSGAFERRFTRITVFEPTRDETMRILENHRSKLEDFYRVKVSDKALRTIYDMSDRYVRTRYMPDKACDILERSAIKASLSKPADSTDIVEVGDLFISQAISQVTRIPESNIRIDAMGGMVDLEDRLRSRVVGQEEAVRKVAEVVRMTKSDLDVNPERPDGVFLFVGPTGVGKTEMAKALAEALEGSEKRLVRIDMSEYNDQYALSKLIGTAPGYVGYDDEGRLTKAVREDPSAVILLDEMEKAHPKIYESFLQVFDDGRLTDGKGQTISFSHTTIIMTSNLGAEFIYGKARVGFSSDKVDPHEEVAAGIRESLRKHFSPEFLNRIDEIVVFRALDENTLKSIARQKVHVIVQRFAEKSYKINVDDQIIDLCIQSLDFRREGARGLNRSLEETISRPLSRVMIQNPDCKVYSVTRHENDVVVMRGA